MPDAKWTKERVNIPECSVVCQKRIISGDIPLSRVPSSCLQSCPVFIFTFCAISRTAVRRRFHQLWLGRRVKIRIDATACLRWKPYEMDRRRTVWGYLVGLRREHSFHTEVWPTMGNLKQVDGEAVQYAWVLFFCYGSLLLHTVSPRFRIAIGKSSPKPRCADRRQTLRSLRGMRRQSRHLDCLIQFAKLR